MSLLVFSSPCRRRQAGRLVLAGGLVAVLIAVIAALPSRTPSKRDTLRPGPPQAVRTPKEVALTPARRRAINAVLDRFIPSALERRNLEIARGLVTSSFAAGVTDAQWRRGEIPVFPYKPRDAAFHGWTQNYGYRNEISLDILVHPSPEETLGAIAFTGRPEADAQTLAGRCVRSGRLVRKGEEGAAHPCATRFPAEHGHRPERQEQIERELAAAARCRAGVDRPRPDRRPAAERATQPARAARLPPQPHLTQRAGPDTTRSTVPEGTSTGFPPIVTSTLLAAPKRIQKREPGRRTD